MTTSYKEWRKTIDKHYGGLDGFSDAPSIRNMLREERKALDEQSRTRALLTTDEHRKLWDETFEGDRKEMETAIAELEGWLAKRGMEL